MANQLFVEYKVACLGSGIHGAIDLDADDIKLVGVDHADDVPVPATDVDLADILVAARVVTTGNLATKTTTGGTFDSANPQFPGNAGDQFESCVLYKDAAGVAASSPLIAHYDTATGLPFTPNGAPIDVAVNASGWFTI